MGYIMGQNNGDWKLTEKDGAFSIVLYGKMELTDGKIERRIVNQITVGDAQVRKLIDAAVGFLARKKGRK